MPLKPLTRPRWLACMPWFQGSAEAIRAYNLAQDRAKARRALSLSSTSTPSSAPGAPAAAAATPLQLPTLQGCYLKVAQERVRVAAASAALAGLFPAPTSTYDVNRKLPNVHEVAQMASYRAAWAAHNSR